MHELSRHSIRKVPVTFAGDDGGGKEEGKGKFITKVSVLSSDMTSNVIVFA